MKRCLVQVEYPYREIKFSPFFFATFLKSALTSEPQLFAAYVHILSATGAILFWTILHCSCWQIIFCSGDRVWANQNPEPAAGVQQVHRDCNAKQNLPAVIQDGGVGLCPLKKLQQKILTVYIQHIEFLNCYKKACTTLLQILWETLVWPSASLILTLADDFVDILKAWLLWKPKNIDIPFTRLHFEVRQKKTWPNILGEKSEIAAIKM